MGARTDAARQAVVARRGELADELARLEAAGRAAVDIPAKVRRDPVRAAGLAGGAVFLLAGGPRRVLRAVRRAVLGPEADLPKGLLPHEIERALRRLGTDGEKVRGTLEREFADFLESRSEERKRRDLAGTAAGLLGNLMGPLTKRAGRRLAETLFSPEGPDFAATIEKIRTRRSGAGGSAAGSGAPDERDSTGR